MAISGPGTLALKGAGADTYSGPTTLSSSVTVELNKLGANAAIPGDLVINSGANLTFMSNNQIADASTVTLNDSTLDLSNYSDTISSLVLEGTGAASVTTGSGTLSLLGGVTAAADATISGNLNLAAGTHTFDVDSGQILTVNAIVGGSGSLDETGAGTLTLNATNSYAGTTEVSGGTLLMGAANALPVTTALTVDPGSTFELAGFSQTVSSLSGSGGQIDFGSSGPILKTLIPLLRSIPIPTLTVSDATDTTFAGIIEGAGGLTKQGVGTLTLTGANTFTGPINIMAGTLMVDGSLDPSSAVTVQAGATLSGSGTLGTVDDWGTIAPGDASKNGVLTVNNVVFKTGSTYQVALATPSYGILNVRGTADFSGATLSASSSFTPPAFSALTLVQNSSGQSFGSSNFVNLPDGSYLTIGGNSYLSNYDYNVSPHSDDVVLIRFQNTTTVVQSPTPSTTYGGSVTFTAIVSGGASTPTGVVVFEADGSFLGDGTYQGSGTWTYTTSTLSAIVHQVQAVYQGDSQHGSSTSAPITQSVAQATPTVVSVNPVNITYGTALDNGQLSGTAGWTVNGSASTVAGTFTYTSAAGTVLNASNSGQSEAVTFTPTDTTDYTTASATVTVNVAQAPPTVVSVNPVNITYGTALDNGQLSGTASWTVNGSLVPVAGTFTYTSAAGTVLNASNSGQSEAVTFTPTDTTDYTTASATVTVNVAQATPTMVSVNPVNITYGTALDNGQLSGTASWTVNGSLVPVAGTFTYTSAAGTVLNASNSGQSEAVTFTPTDTTDYTTASATATVNVAQATPTVVGVNPVNITYGTALDNGQLSGTASWTVNGSLVPVAGTFTYTSAAGTVLNAGNSGQSEAVTFTPTDTTDYTTASATATMNVAQATPTVVSVNPVNITYGTALANGQLSGTASWTVSGSLVTVAGTFTYTSAAGTVLNASNSGQSEAVTFTPTDTTDYTTASATATVNVAQATPTVVSVNPVNITYGTALANGQLSGTASWTVNGSLVPVAGTFTYTSAAGTVLNAGNSGQSEAVTFTPTDTTDYTTASATATINVSQATPTIGGRQPGQHHLRHGPG